MFTDDITMMYHLYKICIECSQRNYLATKHIFTIFYILKNEETALFCNLFMEWPSYHAPDSFDLYNCKCVCTQRIPNIKRLQITRTAT